MIVSCFVKELQKYNVKFFCGVPDSLLKHFCAYISDNVDEKHHTITANEGNAIALASGHYLATGNPAVVYMQNSGIGNCINPLLSLNDEEVYNIPLLMLIGWRGEPQKKDEPQHIKQGKVTQKLLDAMGVKYSILPDDIEVAKPLIKNAFEYMNKTKKVYAFLVKENTFEKYESSVKRAQKFTMTREYAICECAKLITKKDIIVASTGQISRELYEFRTKTGQAHKQDFLTVGSMGHASSIALGIALERPDKNVFCFDGDGALIMHMGALPVIASKNINNFKHIIFNNEVHDSVGGQPTVANRLDIKALALACGYLKAFSIEDVKELHRTFKQFMQTKGTCLLEIKVKPGARKDLGRPSEKPQKNKEIFMNFLNE